MSSILLIVIAIKMVVIVLRMAFPPNPLIYAVARDISDHIQADFKIQQSEQKYGVVSIFGISKQDLLRTSWINSVNWIGDSINIAKKK